MKKRTPFLSGERLVDFCRQMTMLLGAGWSPEEAVDLLAEEEPGWGPLGRPSGIRTWPRPWRPPGRAMPIS